MGEMNKTKKSKIAKKKQNDQLQRINPEKLFAKLLHGLWQTCPKADTEAATDPPLLLGM